ncbi:winged helix-turn-helix transcriptional regulator [Vagococcus coleopterorum]|uniref:Winged helix-turn-helix transcriptional regulator n=1 Tax=Vagococcus coleopterorum TaxID=2714946 RepID=A0A6G8APN2_9ENTE|nr:metalloregulator ArsR/SmtB family transcription factor [Vagococcus coleopterorum]QIL46902.1 winged helix-turn-helix transcriptional regulator [Vagococcus coleopterorum]
MPVLNATPAVIAKVSQFYKALSEPTRLRILTILSESEKNVSSIVAEIGLEQSAVSHQLKILRDANLVKTRREGKGIFYSLSDDHVVDILGQSFTHVKHSK